MEKELIGDKTSKVLKELLEEISSKSAMTIGYPVSKDFDYSELLPFLKYPLNNVGDPFIPSTYTVGSRELEKEVIAFCSKLFR
ncbi:MAG: hypothetical protein ACXVIY_07425, partial [Mucilaginibacter sp.]